MTVDAPSPRSGDTPASAADATPQAKHPRGRVIAAWMAVVVLAALAATWVVAGFNPSLEPVGVSWQSPAFVEHTDASTSDGEATWVAWDDDDEAWASVVVRNPRPYPVTLSGMSTTDPAEVQVAAFDVEERGYFIGPQDVSPVPELRLRSGGSAVVLLHVSDRCVPMMAGGATGVDVATVKVTSLGITRTLEVPFPATYMAGTTTGHDADPTCAVQ